MVKSLSLFGRILFAVPLAGFGILHLIRPYEMSGFVPNFLSWGSVFFVVFTGIALLLASISIVLNKFIKLSTFLLGMMLLIIAFGFHLVNLIGGDQMSVSEFLKDIALAGAAFFISAKSEH